MIYTSYISNLSKMPLHIIPIAISRYMPKGLKCVHYSLLAPSVSLLLGYKNGTISQSQYEKKFMSYLNKLDVSLVHEQLLSFGKNVVLLCYERPDAFCHRHIVAKWFMSNGIDCCEYVK